MSIVFTNEEIRVITRVMGNLMAAAFAADDDDHALLESIYYKAIQHCTEEEAG